MLGWTSPNRLRAPTLALLASLAAPAFLTAQAIQGRVVAEASGERIATALVELLPARGDTEAVRRVVADSEGGFLVRAPSTGEYRLRVSRIGYQTVTTQAFDLVQDEPPFEVELRIAVEVLPLEPLHVVSDRPARLHPRLHTRGYYERRRTWGSKGMGFGHFLEGQEIERTNPFLVTDIFRGLPGVHVVGAGGRGQAITLRNLARGGVVGERCIPTVFVDGMPMADGRNIDSFVQVPEVLAVEVYPGLTMPARFMRGDLCGAVAIWTGSPSVASIAEFQDFASRTPVRLSLELRAGPGLGDFVPISSGLHWAPKMGWRVSVDWRLFPRVSLYGAFTNSPFGCERAPCDDQRVRFLSRGPALGLRGDLDIVGQPWAQVGAVRHRLQVIWDESGEAQKETTSSALGVEVAAGVRVPLGDRLAVAPGVRFVRYTTPQEVRLVTLDIGLRVKL